MRIRSESATQQVSHSAKTTIMFWRGFRQNIIKVDGVRAQHTAPHVEYKPVLLVLFSLWLLLWAVPLFAQEATPAGVTYDDVNTIAGKMYCPECENIPLDKCGTPVCVQWKSEIADQIAAGRSEQDIIDGFVARFGDQILGIPQDPALRNLALFAPYILAGLALLTGSITFWRWRSHQPQPAQTQVDLPPAEETDYRSRIERDLDF